MVGTSIIKSVNDGGLTWSQLLDLRLKYKNDPEVLDLITVYEKTEEMGGACEDLYNNSLDIIDELQGELRTAKAELAAEQDDVKYFKDQASQCDKMKDTLDLIKDELDVMELDEDPDINIRCTVKEWADTLRRLVSR